MNEWNEFRALDLEKIIDEKNNLCIFDLRNIYNPKEIKELGFNYLEQEHKYLIENFDKEVLREYDIRGIVGQNINENTAYTIGRTFGHTVKSKLNSNTIVTGCDGRLTSPLLQKALCYGLRDAGAKVINIGMGPTPMTYFAHYHLNADAAVMVTGSPNPSSTTASKWFLISTLFLLTILKTFKN